MDRWLKKFEDNSNKPTRGRRGKTDTRGKTVTFNNFSIISNFYEYLLYLNFFVQVIFV